jgi:uncharacterized membrane protein YgdD (TMEM256/DUF423 family)
LPLPACMPKLRRRQAPAPATCCSFTPLAVVGGAALLQHGVVWRALLILALAGWVLGAALFSGDLALRAFTGHRLFAMAAPAGGIILIAAWLALAAAALAALWRG